jgi:prolyl oligopeptidase
MNRTLRSRRPGVALAVLGLFLGVGVVGAVVAMNAGTNGSDSTVAGPPVAKVRGITEEFFGVKVEDPYRYMEDLKNPEVAAWFKAQNEYTAGVLTAIPSRGAVIARLKTLDEGAAARVFDVRRVPGGHYFYQKRLANEDVARVFVREGLAGSEKVLVDPTKFMTAGGPHFVISYYTPSLDGKYVAAGLSPAGSEDAVLRVVDSESGKETGDVIDRAQFGAISWLPDGHSFLYNRLQKLTASSGPNDRYLNSRMYLHVLGSDPEKDRQVFSSETPGVKAEATDIPIVQTFEGSRYVVGTLNHGVQNELTVYAALLDDVKNGKATWNLVCDVADDVTGFDVHGDELFLLSHHGAPRFKVLRTNFSNPSASGAEIVVPPSEAVIQSLGVARDALYVQSLDGGLGKLLRLSYAAGSTAAQIALPFDGSVGLTAMDPRLPGTLVAMTAWTKGPKVYAFDPEHKTLTDTKLQPVGKFDEPADLESMEVRVKSHDGAMVPLSIVHKKGLKLGGSSPTWLEGYGSYGITIDPHFDPRFLAWYERGGVFAVAHVRGGGEYGEDWHLAGKQLTKPNTWKDMIACAEYLIQQKYTAAPRLLIEGGSAGGITIGRSITARPDLFAVALDEVPDSDMLRTEFSPSGVLNTPEFGTVKEPDGFKALYEMSAYHHVKDGTKYPAVLLTTGFNDPRVPSWHPGKMAARLQAATSSGKPVLLRVDYDAGHGIGSTKTQRELELADQMSFALWQFGVEGFQPAKN